MANKLIDTNREFWDVNKLKNEYKDIQFSVSDDQTVYVCSGRKVWIVPNVKTIIIGEEDYYFIHKENNNKIRNLKYKICVAVGMPITLPKEYVDYIKLVPPYD